MWYLPAVMYSHHDGAVLNAINVAGELFRRRAKKRVKHGGSEYTDSCCSFLQIPTYNTTEGS